MKNRNKNKLRGGITIEELLIIIVVIGLLAAIIIPAYQRIRLNSAVITSVEKTADSFVLIEEFVTPDYVKFFLLKHKETGIVYIARQNFFTPLVDKDGRPFVKN